MNASKKIEQVKKANSDLSRENQDLHETIEVKNVFQEENEQEIRELKE